LKIPIEVKSFSLSTIVHFVSITGAFAVSQGLNNGNNHLISAAFRLSKANNVSIPHLQGHTFTPYPAVDPVFQKDHPNLELSRAAKHDQEDPLASIILYLKGSLCQCKPSPKTTFLSQRLLTLHKGHRRSADPILKFHPIGLIIPPSQPPVPDPDPSIGMVAQTIRLDLWLSLDFC